jgi:hypothetical protein
MTVDAATTLGIITPDQAEKIGIQLAQDLKVKGTKLDSFSVHGTTESCNRMIQGIVQAEK